MGHEWDPHGSISKPAGCAAADHAFDRKLEIYTLILFDALNFVQS